MDRNQVREQILRDLFDPTTANMIIAIIKLTDAFIDARSEMALLQAKVEKGELGPPSTPNSEA